MRRLPFLILFILIGQFSFGQSPHENSINIDCSFCHDPNDWTVDIKRSKEFNHSTTGFELKGQHLSINCITCHTTLVFDQVSPQCFSCHNDVHQNTVGLECQNCHTSDSWMVTDIKEIHDQSRFPLLGAHQTADCIQCHSNFQNLYFEPISVDCFSCHQTDYNSTTSPNHAAAGFSTDCQDCHSIVSNNWAAENFNHDFFPLMGGHRIDNCFSCHLQGGNFSGLSTNCYSCHQQDYEQVQDPNHITGNFPTDCTLCHTINGWEPANFDHNNTQFPLTGAHTSTECSSCHSQTFSGTPTACVQCHQQNFNATVNPNHASLGISTECMTCHNTTAWIPSSFTHSATGFQLLGQHSVAECSSCHQGTTTGLNQECVSCHQTDYNQSTNPNHSALSIPTECQTCHEPTENWEPASFPIHNNYYQLIGAHAAIANDCMTCHNGNYNTTPNLCVGCHQEDYNNTTNPSHMAANFPTTCESCHSQNAWTPATFNHDEQFFPIYSGKHRGEWNECSDCHTNPSNFAVFSCITCHEHNQNDMDDKHQGISGYAYNSEACLACHPDGSEGNAFNHSLSNFPLTGEHLTIDCQQCHQQGYVGTSTECVSCHQIDYNSTSNPNHQALSLSTNCNDCHSTEAGWEPASFPQHNQYFEFTGRHLDVANDCISCHGGNYSTTSSECLTCHNDNYQATQNPNHQSIGLTTDCQSCHTTSGWTPSTFNHVSTGFNLAGQHSVINCSSCHIGSTQLNEECMSCHQENYNAAPNHLTQNYPTNCEMCHSAVAWSQVSFDHQVTAFPLTGTHTTTSCSGCHESGFAGTPTECVACHNDLYNNSINPNHQAAGIPIDCQSCHNTTSWSPSTFNHITAGFELLGQHASIQCSSCHEGTLTGLDHLCLSCHQNDFNIAPNHVSQNYPTTCEICHNSIAWSQVTFNHQTTAFPLTGSHTTVGCLNCHESGFTGTATQCFACHNDSYNNAINPNHQAAGIATECQTCHNTTAWIPSTFNHISTGFELLGQHSSIQCSSCHAGTTTGLDQLCISCHQDNYNTAPNHSSQNYPTTCEICHNSVAWSQVTFSHQSTNFPLTGGHINVNCSSCHSGGFSGTTTVCSECHQSNYNNSTNPSHTALSLPTNCENCHSTSPGWEPATFPIHNNFYQLLGAHSGIANNCVTCHNGNYNSTTNTCYGCHQSAFNSATNPNHQLAGFPHECESCHTQIAWEPSTFNHDNQYFPIYSGRHQGRWSLCSDCHTDPTNFNVFSCIDCHEHNQTSTNSHHQGVSGYVYNSQACYNCHPDGGDHPIFFDSRERIN